VPFSRVQSTSCCSATARYIAQMIDAGELIVIDTLTSPKGMPRNKTSISSSEEIATPHRPVSPSAIG
jgi:hypothetical protein